MAKRKRGGHQAGKPHAKRTNAKMTLQQREERVKTAMQHGHDKEAIVHLKQMLKQERRPEWEAWMLEAHHRQTHRLLQTGKYRESVSLFESGHQLCGLSLDCADYIQSLLQLNQTTQAAERYVAAQSSLPKADLFRLRVELGALALAGDGQILKLLPANDPVVADFDKALALLENWCANDDAGLKQDLKALSFRSPYRDLRALLSASLPENGSTGVDHERLARITAESPYQQLAMLLHTASLDNQQVLSSLAGLKDEEKRFLMELKGWSKEEGKRAEKLAKLPHEPDYASVFRIADEYKASHTESLRSIAKMAAIHGAAHNNRAVNLSRFEKRFGRLNKSEKVHAEARSILFAYKHGLLEDNGYELGDYMQLERVWIDYISVVNRADEIDDIAFRSALVNRYLTRLWVKTGSPINEVSVSNLERSLQIDPQDKSTHLMLIEYYLEINQPKKARAAVKHALEVYPEDTSILLAAIRSAVAGNTFKKAAGYAKQILSVDPINVEARRLLHRAHLSHARKQAGVGKWHLVRKELQAAICWTDDPFAKASCLILEACCEQQAKQSKTAMERLNEASNLAGHEINASFIIQYEANNIGYDATELYSQAGINWPLSPLQHKDELFSLTDIIEAFLNEDNMDQIALTLSRFVLPLSQAVRLVQTPEEFEQLCELWHRTRQEGLLDAYAEEAASQFEHRPIFTYFRMVNNSWLGPDDFQRVESALEAAKEQGNQALAMRFLSLLTELAPPALGGVNFPRDISDLAGDDFDDDPFGNETALYSEGEIINLIRTADMDEVLNNLEFMGDIPRDQMEPIRTMIGDNALRELLVSALQGEHIEDLQDLMPGSDQPPRRRNKKKKPKKKSNDNDRQRGLFE